MKPHTHRPASLLPAWTPAALRRSAYASLTACMLLAVGTAACSGGGDDKVSVAQVAVRANPDLELMATDAQQGVLTVRVRKTEQVLTVKVDDVIAGTAFANLQAAAPAPEPAAAAAPPAASGSKMEITTPGARVSMGTGADGKSSVSVNAGGGSASASGGSGEVGSARERLREAGRALGSTLPADAQPPSAAPAPSAAQAPAPAPAPAPRREEASLRRRTSPVLCNGKDSVRLENVLLEVDSVAVSANGHCNVLISGSHIIGRMGGVSVNGNATVTIENSQIEGAVAFSVNGDGEISVEGSRIEGAVQSRRKSSVRDLGRNVWR